MDINNLMLKIKLIMNFKEFINYNFVKKWKINHRKQNKKSNLIYLSVSKLTQ